MTSRWRKSSRSAGMGQCLEARAHGGQLQIRDSKMGDASPIITVAGADFASFLTSLRR